ncbi:MAG: PH domain-containing protein [Prevotellaceae bacterium]|jgi:hypothetical protein|nr:PH domain-containing protein [Prevotellaceae bacterium]
MTGKFNVKWSWKVKIITIIVAIIMINAEILLINSICTNNNIWRIAIIILIAFAFGFILIAPVSIQVKGNRILLKRVLGKIIVYFDNIESITHYKFSKHDIRVFGSGGYGGYLGIFSNAQIGKYSVYVGDFSQAFLIQLKNGKNYVFSCENRDFVIETVKKHIL